MIENASMVGRRGKSAISGPESIVRYTTWPEVALLIAQKFLAAAAQP